MIPSVVKTYPLNGETNVPQSTIIYAVFNTALQPSSVNTINVLLYKTEDNGLLSQIYGNVSYDDTTKTVSIQPVYPLELGKTYRIVLKGDNNYNDLIKVGIMSINNEPMVGDYIFSFTITTIGSSDDDDDDNQQQEEITPSGILSVIATDPQNGTIMYTGLSTTIKFNDNLIIPQSGVTTFGRYLNNEEETLKHYISIYRMTTYGSDTYNYISTGFDSIDYDYTLNDDLLTLVFRNTGTQLPYNNKFIVTVNPGLSGEHTYPMETGYQYSFTWFLTPLYTTPQMIRYNAGPFLNFASDEYLYQLINAKSIEIYRLFKEAGQYLPFYPQDSGVVPSYVSQWVLCSVKLDLFRQMLGMMASMGGRVTLGDFTVDNGDIDRFLKPEITNLEQCVLATTQYINDLLYPQIKNIVPHLYDTRAPWFDRDGRYRTTWKGEPPDD